MYRYLRSLIVRSICIVSGLFLSTSCSEKDEPLPPVTADRTILVYMAANNSLGYGYDSYDINEMREAVQNGALGDNNRLMIFRAPTDGSQTLYEMTENGELTTVKVYDTALTPIHSDRMLEVFTDAKTVAPANDYGLILWSHSLGWTQEGIDDNGPGIMTLSWGNHLGKTMNITTLKRVLEASPWSWIYFDCCFMGSVEVAYELSGVLPRMVASAAEVPLDGMPYQENLPLLFAKNADLEGAALNTFNYYNDLFGSNRTCTISVYDLTKMDQLAQATVPLYQASQIVGPHDFPNLALETGSSPRYYDLGVYVHGLCTVNQLEDSGSSPQEKWEEAYRNVVVFERATPKLWNIIDLSRFTGMSTFIPANAEQQTYRNYHTLAWYKDVARWLYNKD